MSVDYAKPLPTDRKGNALQEYPPAASAIGTLARDNASASSVTSLHANATVIEVAAVTTPATIKWASDQATSVVSAAGTPNFDHVIQTGEVRRFVIPRLTQALPNYNNAGSPSIVGLNIAEGLFSAVATKSTGVGSVLLTQY
jgi:hypothetical protein